MGSEPTRNVFACTWCCRSWRWVGAGCADTEVTASAVSCQELSCFHGVISCLWGRILFMKIASDVPFLAARTISLYPTYFCPCTDVRGTLRACLYSGSVLEGNNWYSTGLGTVWMPCCCVGSTYTWFSPLLFAINDQLQLWCHEQAAPQPCCIPSCVRGYRACHRGKLNISVLWDLWAGIWSLLSLCLRSAFCCDLKAALALFRRPFHRCCHYKPETRQSYRQKCVLQSQDHSTTQILCKA